MTIAQTAFRGTRFVATLLQIGWPGTSRSRENAYIIRDAEVTDAVSDAVRAAIQSGLPTTFAYDVSLQKSSRWWFDRTIAYMRVSAVVRFDNLTRRYQITFIEDGRVEEVRTTDDESTALQLLTNFRGRRLSSHRLVEDGEYHVSVKAQTRPRLLGWAWPWTPGGASSPSTVSALP